MANIAINQHSQNWTYAPPTKQVVPIIITIMPTQTRFQLKTWPLVSYEKLILKTKKHHNPKDSPGPMKNPSNTGESAVVCDVRQSIDRLNQMIETQNTQKRSHSLPNSSCKLIH